MNMTKFGLLFFGFMTVAAKGQSYVTLDSDQTDLTFHSNTTYYVTGPVNLDGTITFEAGTVIKFALDPSAGLTIALPSDWDPEDFGFHLPPEEQ